MSQTVGYELKPVEETDGQTISVQTKVNTEESMEVALPEPKSIKITEKEAEDACKILGLKPVRIKKLSKSAIVGRFMQQLGAVSIGQGKLMIADQQIEKGIRMCDRFLMEHTGDPEAVSSLMKVRLGLVEAMLKTAHTLIKVNKDSGAVDLELKPLNQAFPANTPVQNNVQVNVMASEPKTS